ncbi:type II toxin-antitoxin system RelE/ParE family toxin [Entomobacter blattae]|uniref:Toxin HigB-1 n=1 Tax=Entomobacter blattae TaxID=2762277 RepID=A0A7H1NTZ2_9PROT|nr:type II toxin-antitoxin system RelE/ParE family toxin [Entomobacter blattae]QNT79252.1 Toxin HigB-1 [Entomobacter blattae]
MTIQSFADKETQALYETDKSRKWNSLAKVAFRKLYMLDAAEQVDDLRAPPGNRLEKLSGDREGRYSIRINDQFRLCFIWTAKGAENVEIVDYH